MKIDIQLADLLTIIGIFVGGVVAFVRLNYKLREFVKAEDEVLEKRIRELEVEIRVMKNQQSTQAVDKFAPLLDDIINPNNK